MNLFEKLNRLDDSLVESRRVVKKKKLTESIEDVSRRAKFLKEVFTKWEIIDLAEAHTDFTGRTYKEAFNYVLNNWDNFYFEDEYEAFCEDELDDDIDEMLTENTLTNYLPPSVDNMLMDMAQMCGEFNYADVYRFTKAGVDDDIVRKLKNLYRRWNRAAEYNNEEKMCILAKEAAQIIGKVSLTENRNNPYFKPFGYRDAVKVINRKAPEYYYHLKEIEMDQGDGVKLARYALRKGLPVMVDKNSDPDYPEFAIKGEYHWNDYFYPYPTAHEEDLVAWDGKMFVEEQLTESCEYTVKRYGEWHWGIIGPDKLMVRQDDGKLLLFKSKDEAVAYIDTLCKNTLTEGNNVSSQLPPAIDSFLQDIAQMYGTITYKDIMEHIYTEEDLKKLKNYRRRFNAEIPYEDDEESDAILNDIAEKVAILLKNTHLNESNTKTGYSYKNYTICYGYKDADRWYVKDGNNNFVGTVSGYSTEEEAKDYIDSVTED